MADVLSFNLTQAKSHSPRKFKRPDLSTKLKLLGVEVASFGDFFFVIGMDQSSYLLEQRRKLSSLKMLSANLQTALHLHQSKP